MAEVIFTKQSFLKKGNKEKLLRECMEKFIEFDRNCSLIKENRMHQETPEMDATLRSKIAKLNEIEELARELGSERSQEIENLREQVHRVIIEHEMNIEANKLCEAIPPNLFKSALASLEEYRMKKVMGHKKPLLQCVSGTIEYECCDDESASVLREKYGVCRSGNQIKLPVVHERSEPVSQMYLYKHAERSDVWKHFQTLCREQMLLQRGFPFELNVVADGRPSDEAGFHYLTSQEAAERLERILQESQHMEKKQRACFAFWNLPEALSANHLRILSRRLEQLRESGYIFLFMVNEETVQNPEIERELQYLCDKMQVLEYDSNRDAYVDLKQEYISYEIERMEE